MAITGLAAVWWRARGKKDLIPGPEILGATSDGKRTFYALVPLILGIHVGLPLIVLGVKGELFSPNNQLHGAWVYWLGVAEIGLGLSFLYGGLTRIAGVGLGLVWLVGAAVIGLEPMLENLHYLGYAAFFFLAGRGPYSMDRLLFPALKPTAQQARWAMPCLRIGTALGLTVVALTEKLANPQLAEAFLHEYPLNFTDWMGIPMSNQLFIFLRRHHGADYRIVSRVRPFSASHHHHGLAIHQHDPDDLQLGGTRRSPAALRSHGHAACLDTAASRAATLGRRRVARLKVRDKSAQLYPNFWVETVLRIESAGKPPALRARRADDYYFFGASRLFQPD